VAGTRSAGHDGSPKQNERSTVWGVGEMVGVGVGRTWHVHASGVVEDEGRRGGVGHVEDLGSVVQLDHFRVLEVEAREEALWAQRRWG
jgi:hypothetical protein